ncbi:serine/threonine-protein kinase [Gemmatimonas aurantiaca]|uniref:serine/threonine-protein kinase n=1 Tax=Gemmatimonas aurantiaca TaxID=173480 RepID=UPI00301CAD0E
MTQPSREFLDFQAAIAGEYSLRRELGRGGMGIVYLARDVQLDRDVAIKVLPAHLAKSAEARIAAGLSHPNIVPIHRVGETGGFVFFVMSYVEGETLGERLRAHGPLSSADAMRVMREVAWAMAYAHGRGIVHRDVKPDNILLESKTDRALVSDFGIARGAAQGQAAELGPIMGTAHFMSPEQALGLGVDGRSDIYALGVVGYLAVSGRLPFEARNSVALAARQATDVAPGVLHASPGLPPALSAVIDRCLAPDPSDRFADGEAVASALSQPTDPRPTLPAALRLWLGARNRALPIYATWSATCGLAAVAGVADMVFYGRLNSLGAVLSALALAGVPLLPMLGSHLTQARRLFRGGHTLGDLRLALDIAARERSADEPLANKERVGLPQKLLRSATYSAATWSAAAALLAYARSAGIESLFAPFILTATLGTLSNALEVTLIPAAARRMLQPGLRERLWKSRVGAWLARRLGAADESRAIDGGAFRATEVALGIAASDLFAALPKVYREQLAELPAMVEELEARAAAARAELDVVAALAPTGAGADVLEARRGSASEQLARTVAALEGIRLDLLRLHAGDGDLAPLTMLIDAARLLGEDVRRLADASREANRVAAHRLPAARQIPTPT